MSCHLCDAKRLLDFEGALNVKDRKFDLTIKSEEEGRLILKGRSLSSHDYHLYVDCEHLKTNRFDFSSQIEASLDFSGIKPGSEKNISGKIWSQYSLLNYKPIRELSGRFEVKNNRLFLHSLFFASVSARGYIDLLSPHNMNLEFGLFSIGMDDFIDFWVKNRKYDASGLVSGRINVSGDRKHWNLKGVLEGSQGFIKRLHYNKIQLNAEGLYPNLRIADSVLSKSDGVSFVIKGNMDLSDQKNFSKQIKMLTIAPLVNDSDAQVEWTIKRLESDDLGSMELKYLLRDEDQNDFSKEENLDMFGVQRTMQF